MKNYLSKAVALIFVVLLFAGSVSAQKHYVKVQPQEQEVGAQSRSSAPAEITFGKPVTGDGVMAGMYGIRVPGFALLFRVPDGILAVG